MHAGARANLNAPPLGEAGRPTGAAWQARAALRQDGEGRTSFRAIVTSSAFLVVFAVGLLVSGGAAIHPLFRAAIEAREVHGGGDIVYSLPDGRLCRHMSFNNTTAEITPGEVVPCPDSVTRGLFHNKRGFAWGER